MDLEGREFKVCRQTHRHDQSNRGRSCPASTRLTLLPPPTINTADTSPSDTTSPDQLQPGPTFWPKVKNNLIKAFAGHHIGIPRTSLYLPSTCCTICSTDLIISGLQPASADMINTQATPDQELGVLLACGHVLGRDCIQNWRYACIANNQTFNCPICRFDLQPTRCKAHGLHPIIHLSEETNEFGLLMGGVNPLAVHQEQEIEACLACGNTKAHKRRGMQITVDQLRSMVQRQQELSAALIHLEWMGAR